MQAETKTPVVKSSFALKLEESIREIFPLSHVDAVQLKLTGDPFISIRFSLGKDASEYINGYFENDDFTHRITIDGVSSEFSLIKGGKLDVSSSCNSFSVKPEPGSYLAFGRVKTGWRNFKTDSEDKAVKKIVDYFKNMKQLISENVDKLTENSKNLIKAKKYI